MAMIKVTQEQMLDSLFAVLATNCIMEMTKNHAGLEETLQEHDLTPDQLFSMLENIIGNFGLDNLNEFSNNVIRQYIPSVKIVHQSFLQ